jgi:hypothetical protein
MGVLLTVLLFNVAGACEPGPLAVASDSGFDRIPRASGARAGSTDAMGIVTPDGAQERTTLEAFDEEESDGRDDIARIVVLGREHLNLVGVDSCSRSTLVQARSTITGRPLFLACHRFVC